MSPAWYHMHDDGTYLMLVLYLGVKLTLSHASHNTEAQHDRNTQSAIYSSGLTAAQFASGRACARACLSSRLAASDDGGFIAAGRCPMRRAALTLG